MNPKRRAYYISRIANEIPAIGRSFERFGASVLDEVLDVEMIHPGLNVAGFEVSRVVDSVSVDGSVVAEYSAENHYFDGSMQKAMKDVGHALSRQPQASHIYLLAAMEKRPQKAEEFETKIRQLPAMTGRSLHVWGAEEIAGKLLDHVLHRASASGRIAHYLPIMRQIADEVAISSVPPLPDSRRVPRHEIDAEITQRLKTRNVVVLAGLSGIGKSDAAASYSAAHADEYDFPIWLDGTTVERAERLSAVPSNFGGEPRNIVGLLKHNSCLLILDDAPDTIDVSALNLLCGSTSRIILTRRQLTEGAYQLPMMDAHSARELLNSQVSTVCPEHIFKDIWKTVKGHPMSLGLINAAVTSGASWLD